MSNTGLPDAFRPSNLMALGGGAEGHTFGEHLVVCPKPLYFVGVSP